MVDIAYRLHTLVPGAVYSGSLTAGTEAAYDAIVWGDVTPKPLWVDILAQTDPPPNPIQVSGQYDLTTSTLTPGSTGVASATKLSTGNVEIYFSVPMVNTNYKVLATVNTLAGSTVRYTFKFTDRVRLTVNADTVVSFLIIP